MRDVFSLRRTFEEIIVRIICSYCRKEMGEKEPLADSSSTHGICPECYQHFSRQLEGYHLSDYLDTFEEPMVVLNSDYRVLAYNKSYAEAFLGEKTRPVGLLGGEFLDCANSRLPEGCGHAVHCRTCAIRNTITTTIRTGEPQKNVTAYLKTAENGKPVVKNLRLSAEMHGLMVRMVIEEDISRAVDVAS